MASTNLTIRRGSGSVEGPGGAAKAPVRRTSGTNVGQAERVASAALGGALVLLGLGRRSLAGAVAVVAGGGLLYRAATGHSHVYEALGLDTASDRRSEGAVEVVGAVTIGRPAEELDRLWRQPETLTRIMAHFAEVTPAGDGRTHWRVRGPLGRCLEWDTRVVEDRPGEGLRWESAEGADVHNEGEVRFRPAPADWGTEMTLRARFDPPGGELGRAVAKLLGIVPELFAEKSLLYFKCLAETGEIPTTEHQPAVRADTR